MAIGRNVCSQYMQSKHWLLTQLSFPEDVYRLGYGFCSAESPGIVITKFGVVMAIDDSCLLKFVP